MDQRSDRREFARVAVALDVDVASDEEQRWLVSSDVSEGGMRFGFVSLPTGAPLQLTFSLPDEKQATRPIVVDGEVAWRRLSSTGVRFSKLPAEERARLRAFLEGRAQA